MAAFAKRGPHSPFPRRPWLQLQDPASLKQRNLWEGAEGGPYTPRKRPLTQTHTAASARSPLKENPICTLVTAAGTHWVPALIPAHPLQLCFHGSALPWARLGSAETRANAGFVTFQPWDCRQVTQCLWVSASSSVTGGDALAVPSLDSQREALPGRSSSWVHLWHRCRRTAMDSLSQYMWNRYLWNTQSSL